MTRFTPESSILSATSSGPDMTSHDPCCAWTWREHCKRALWTSLIRRHLQTFAGIRFYPGGFVLNRMMFACRDTCDKSMMTIPTPTVWTPPWYATIPNLLFVFAVPIVLKIFWRCIINSPESCTSNVSPYGLTLVVFCWWDAAFSEYQFVHGFLPPPLCHHNSLDCW